jgi:type I restriction enzyme M protein
MAQLEHYASNEYFMPVMGLIFLRHAYSRYLQVRHAIEGTLPKRGGKTPELKKEDFSQKSSIFLQPLAQFDHLVSLSDSDDRAQAVIAAMESIEADYESLRGILPKQKYQELDNQVLGQLVRTLNPEELKKASGDMFGRIYEYFLTQFADLKAHDGGEFFTPISLVSLIANVLEPDQGIVLDPACGSGGMFVQSTHFVEAHQKNPNQLTFLGLEKNPTIIRLAKMNLAVHGLEGNIQRAITYYEDPHQVLGKAHIVMTNSPFNVHEVDEDKVKMDPRLSFGLPGVNKKKVTNGNYLWISYFYSYLNEKRQAGFVMSSQTSSAGGDGAKVREKLIQFGSVDIMIAIRSNFFYTPTVPCELWFLNRDKPKHYQDKVLMIDARNVYRKVTHKIYDFSPEQLNNILAIVWLYRDQTNRFLRLLAVYVTETLQQGLACFGDPALLLSFITTIKDFREKLDPYAAVLIGDVSPIQEFDVGIPQFVTDVEGFKEKVSEEWNLWKPGSVLEIQALTVVINRLDGLAETSRDLVKQCHLVYKLGCRAADGCEAEAGKGNGKEITKARKAADLARQDAEQLRLVRYFHKQAVWVIEQFPEGIFRDVDGLVKLVDLSELKKADWSLTPGRYVKVAPEDVDEDFDFEETLRDIHIEFEGLNQEAVELAAKIAQNFKELGI